MTRIGRGTIIYLFNYLKGELKDLMVVELNNGEYLIKIIIK